MSVVLEMVSLDICWCQVVAIYLLLVEGKSRHSLSKIILMTLQLIKWIDLSELFFQNSVSAILNVEKTFFFRFKTFFSSKIAF